MHAGTHDDPFPADGITRAMAAFRETGGEVFVPGSEWTVRSPISNWVDYIDLEGVGDWTNLVVPPRNDFSRTGNSVIDIRGPRRGIGLRDMAFNAGSSAARIGVKLDLSLCGLFQGLTFNQFDRGIQTTRGKGNIYSRIRAY